MASTCKICKQKVEELFESLVLQKYKVKYYQCTVCGFIQTEEPYWLDEAYNSPIGLLDVGLLQRNQMLADRTPAILDLILNSNGKYLDYGGGYGVFVRLMRDKGYDFYLEDKFCKNLYAQFFELKDAGIKNGFKCLTAFEVFEHLVTPLDEIDAMFKFSDTILFSTELQPDIEIKSVENWWYFVPEGGQHVSFYSLQSLEKLSTHFGCYFYTNKVNLHILSKKPMISDPFVEKQPLSLTQRILNKFFNGGTTFTAPKRESLLMKDFEYYKTKL